MCGIVGIYNLNHQLNDEHELQAILQNMTNVIDYRGPDDEGYFVENKIGLGFKRLAIVDLNDGQQPITSNSQNSVLVCNGEIYNHLSLRKTLEAKGYHFRSHCDVEVIVHLYEAYGEQLLEKLNGQFAFALYEKQKHKLVLARDHVGIAPLFYTVADGVLVFGSEIKALLQHPLVRREINLTGLDQILTFPGMISPQTMFKGIYALKPGHYLVAEKGRVSTHEYWDLDYPVAGDHDTQLSETDALEGLEEHLLRAVQCRLQGDVPTGLYLSGGLDSSLIAGLVNHLSDEQRHSFSIGFTEANINETHYQQLMAKQINAIHHELTFGWQQIAENLPRAVYHAESPLKESYNTCTLALSGLVHEHDMRVVLTGEGADELFAGYVGYRFDHQRSQDESGAFDLEAMLEQEVQEKLWGDGSFFYEKSYASFKDTKQVLYSDKVLDSFHEFETTGYPLFNLNRLSGRHQIHKRSYLDFKTRLSDHLLADHSDRVAYANSVEARYPFLDVALIEFASRFPPDFLLKGMVEKYPLKQIAKKYVPDNIINREKFSFVAPGSPFLIKQNIEWVNDMLSNDYIKKSGYFNPLAVDSLKKQYADDSFEINQTFEDDFLMTVLTFGLFKEQFGLSDYY